VDSCPLGGAAGDAAKAGGCPDLVLDGVGDAPVSGGGRRGGGGRAPGGAADPSRSIRFPPVGHDGTERRLERPQEPTEQTRYYSGKKKIIYGEKRAADQRGTHDALPVLCGICHRGPTLYYAPRCAVQPYP
jgi:hypothetical protein